MLHFDVIQSIALAGNAAGANDDRVGSSARRAWIVDGATDLGPPGLMGARTGASWIADAADHGFAAAPDGDLAAAIGHVFAVISERYERERSREPEGRWELPSGAFLAVALEGAGTGASLSLAWLADCACLLLRGEEVERVGPQPDGAELAHAQAIIDAGHDIMPHRSESGIHHMRVHRSRDERRALTVEPHHADAVHYARIPVQPGDEIVLMTDGFAALIDDYGWSTAEFAARLRSEGLHGLAVELRSIEQGDAEGTAFIRFKPSDDATALWLRVA